MARFWRPRSVFICERCRVWRVRVAAPWCENEHPPQHCVRVARDQFNAQMERHLSRANTAHGSPRRALPTSAEKEPAP